MPLHWTLALLLISVFLGIGTATRTNSCIGHHNGRCGNKFQCPKRGFGFPAAYGCPSGKICCFVKPTLCGPYGKYYCRRDYECEKRASSFEEYTEDTYDCPNNVICCACEPVTF